MIIFQNEQYTEERVLQGLSKTTVKGCVFEKSAKFALDESVRVTVEGSEFHGEYPLWHSNGTVVKNSNIASDAGSPLWYGKILTVDCSTIEADEALRECNSILMSSTTIEAEEVLQKGSGITITKSTIHSNRGFRESKKINISSSAIAGDGVFEEVDHMVIKNCTIEGNGLFRYSKNVTLTDCEIKGNDFGSFAENMKLVRCTITGSNILRDVLGLQTEECVFTEE